MAYIEENSTVRILLQFSFCMLYSPLRPRSLAYYRIGRRDRLMSRIEAMDWVVYALLIKEDQIEGMIKAEFIDMMNRAWGNEDDDEWLARYR